MASPAAIDAAGDASREALLIESRWPPAIAVLVFMALNIGGRIWLPGDRLGVPWLLPSVEVLLLVVLFAADPGSLLKRRKRLRRVAIALVSVLVLGALWATGLLLYHLIQGAQVTQDPGSSSPPARSCGSGTTSRSRFSIG